MIRDKIAWAIITFGLRVASPWYRAMVVGSVNYGLSAAARDVDDPPDWREHW